MITADGADQPVQFGRTMSLKQEGRNTWKSVSKQDGRTLNEAVWTVSPDGKTSTITSRSTGQKSPEILVFERQ